MNIKKDSKKIQYSLNGNKCIGPCYPGHTHTIHPTTLEFLYDEHPYCPVELNDFNRTSEGIAIQRERCNLDENYTNVHDASNMILHGSNFSCKEYLNLYDDVNSLEDALIKYNHDSNNFGYYIRLVNCCLKIYGGNLIIIDERLIDFVITMLNLMYITKIINIIKPFIVINGDTIKLSQEPVNNSEKLKNINIKKYIKDKFTNKDFIKKFLIRYIKNHKNNWDDINDHLDHLANYFLNYIHKKVLQTKKN